MTKPNNPSGSESLRPIDFAEGRGAARKVFAQVKLEKKYSKQMVNGMKYGSTLQYLEAAHQIELSRPRLGLVVLHQAWSSREIAILPAAARTAGQSFGFDAIRIDNAPARKRYVSIAPMNGLLRRQYEAKRSILTIKKPCNAL